MEQVLDIIKETGHWVAINKPAGLLVERNPFETPTAEGQVSSWLERSGKKSFLGVVHRLDRVTSGVLVFAKKKSALRNLNLQFSQRLVRKTYLAVVFPEPLMNKNQLSGWLVKDQKNKRAVMYQEKTGNALAVRLTYSVLQRSQFGTLLKVEPQTGRFHQIRAQLAFAGSPIVGDVKYGSQVLGVRNIIGLHAYSLEFADPSSGDQVKIKAALPDSHPWNEFMDVTGARICT